MEIAYPYPFRNIPKGQLETLENLLEAFRADRHPLKTNLMVGAFRTSDGLPYVLPAVKEAKRRMFSDLEWNHEYRQSHLGTRSFRDVSQRLFFGTDSLLVKNNRIVSMQALGGSGACHMGAVLLRNHYEPWKTTQRPKVFIPTESWANHSNVFTSQGIEAHYVPYFNSVTQAFDFDSFRATLSGLPSQSVVVLQTGAHNPTGCDPSLEQWKSLATVFEQHGHFAFWDAAYPGLASGCIDEDLAGFRHFAERGIPLLLAATYGKCFGLYCERVGVLSFVVPDESVRERMEVQMRLQARAETGAMPDFGATIVETILLDPELEDQWRRQVRSMAVDLRQRRLQLRQGLERLGTPGHWSHVTDQKGMFSYVQEPGEI
ncbi:aspartate aminotransferase [Pseudovirgaria hyperparasitica]|uniref:Aspartate aminotransferase n=1 Tax=Pseudovirgaria hyperparasitica TaxID=470096 RepID=A0A6A6VSK5_9PEZI|nr:aspartate aminotransferase [Pseudovirgaria hyperparasitica]KAF2753572.1 aspartate aminotransferase [Pseudovirgaria hyperparasitica]